MNFLILLLPFSGFIIDVATLIGYGIYTVYKRFPFLLHVAAASLFAGFGIFLFACFPVGSVSTKFVLLGVMGVGLSLLVTGLKNFFDDGWNFSMTDGGTNKLGVTIIIPAFNEEKTIAECIESAFDQTLPPEKVIVVDDGSTDRTGEIVRSLQKKYPNLHYIRKPKQQGKGRNVSETVMTEDISPVFVVLDADVPITRDYLEKVVEEFKNENTVIVTGASDPQRPLFFEGKISTNGKYFLFNLFGFRKKAQDIRNSVSVICGDSAAYRTDYIRSIGGFPSGTLTEDVDVTWQALEDGKRVKCRMDANARPYDVYNISGHWRQVNRWYKGNTQCMFKHGRRIFKSKRLAFTTILPMWLDSIFYVPFYIFSPLIFLWSPFTAMGFLLLDFLLLVIFSALVDRSGLTHLFEVYFARFIWSTAWLSASIVTTVDYLRGKGKNWVGKWSRPKRKGFDILAPVVIFGALGWFLANSYFVLVFINQSGWYPWILLPLLLFVPSAINLVYQFFRYGVFKRTVLDILWDTDGRVRVNPILTQE
ncbi:MAG: hypothetical protein DRN83_01465 [Hadesarchaea archaeon]|nr:MAG: hypothetical protein DRN83_01465 [Hadesarchaea archaeon]